MLTLLSALGSLLLFRVRSRASLELELVALQHQLTVLRRQRPGRRHLYERRAAGTVCGDRTCTAVAVLGVSPAATAWPGCRRAQSPCAETVSHGSGILFNQRTSSTMAFNDKPSRWPDGILSKDKRRSLPNLSRLSLLKTPKSRERIEFLAPQPHRHRHDPASVRPRLGKPIPWPDDVLRRAGRQVFVPRQQLLVYRPRHVG